MSNLNDLLADQVPHGVVNSMKQRLLNQFNQNTIDSKRLCRSQENLSHSYLKNQPNVIIIEKKSTNLKKNVVVATSDAVVDEIPKPGTVSSVKKLFEQQIRLSRSDQERKCSRSRRFTSPVRPRSISPNDMAIRQRRATTGSSYPDLVISHTPPPINSTSSIAEQTEKSISSTPSDNLEDFKSRLAIFNRPTPIIPMAKPLEKIDPGNELVVRLVVPSQKSVTFFGGQQIAEPIAVIEQPSPLQLDILPGPEKSNQSSLFSGAKKKIRVQFIDRVETFEYLSYEAAMAEYEDDSIDMDQEDSRDEGTEEEIDDDLDRLAQKNSQLNNKLLSDQPIESKGSLHTFRPSSLHSFEINPDAKPSDKSSRLFFENTLSSLTKSDLSNHVQWSALTATTDLLF